MNERRLLIQPAAIADLDRHADFIAKDSPQAALRLLECAEATFQFLSEMPFVGIQCADQFESPRARDLRLWRIKGFPNHQILYRVQLKELLIVRVIHAAQDKIQIFDQ